MLRTRVIPILLLRNKGLVKTIKFDKSKYIGDPINAVKLFNDKEVDELAFIDIDASKERRKPNFNLIKNIATECFMPLSYGGGISALDDIKILINSGVEKVIINTAALNNINLLSQAASIFGDQSIVLSLDIKKNFFGKYQIFSHAKVNFKYQDILSYAKDAVNSGAGEILINSVDRDGCMMGYDINLIKLMTDELKVPVIVCGGAGSLKDLKAGASAGASGVGAGSLFVYHGPHNAVLINYPNQKELKEIFE
jgi:cyclase